jgi:hypothetical protein
MYFAQLHPDQVRRVVALDSLRVPFLIGRKFKILSFRSKGPKFKADPGVGPEEAVRQKSGVAVVQTGYQHTDMSDRGPEDVKTTILVMLDQFLDDDTTLIPIKVIVPEMSEPGSVPEMTEPGPLADPPHRH